MSKSKSFVSRAFLTISWQSLIRCTTYSCDSNFIKSMTEANALSSKAGERFLFRFRLNLENSIADEIQRKLVEHVKTRFKLKLSSVVELRNIADGKTISYYQTIGDSPWLETRIAAENWVKQQEELRLENQHRPNTQWHYEKTLMVYAKVILDRQPLAIGQGFLPDWLRNKRDVIPLDFFNDKLCLFRCIAVHRGAHVRFNIRKTKELAETFFAKRPGLRNRLTDKHIPLLEEHFKQGYCGVHGAPQR